MSGQDVADLQAALNYHLRPPSPPHTPPGPDRPPLATDGQFGSRTNARLREFQSLNGLTVDGIAGPITTGLLTKTKSVTVRIPIARDDDPPVAQNVAAFRPIRGGGLNAFSFPNVFAQAAPTPNVPGTPQTNPPQQPAPLIAPVKLQNLQVQAGGNLTLSPIVGPGDPSKALFLAVQFNWVEQRDGRHLELALGTQFAAPLTNDTLGLGSSSAQLFAGVTVADVLAKGNFHFFSPAAQVAFQANGGPGVIKSLSIGVGLQNQIAWDIIKDKSGKNPVFTLFCQQQLGWTYDFSTREGAIAPAFLAGATWQTNFF